VTIRAYFATDIHGSEVCWRKFLNAGKFYQADTLILGGDISGKAVVPVVARPGGRALIRQFHGDRELEAGEAAVAETRIRDMGFYPFRTTDEELDEIWDDPRAVHAVFLDLMGQTLARWLDLAEAEGGQADLGEGITMISCGYSNRTPWDTPRELDDDELERRIEKLAVQVGRPERAIFNLHVPPARTAIDKAPALDESLKPVVRGGALVMTSVGSEAVRRVLERHQPMLALHGHIHESRGAVRLGSTLSLNPGSQYGDGVLSGALLEIDRKRGVRHYQLPTG
jgi:uncharacterized protein